MTDPVRRLQRPSTPPFARQLLESARAERSAAGARDRALLGLGLSPVALLASAPPAAAAVAPPKVAAGALTAGKAAAPWLVGKSLLVGLVGSLATLGIIHGVLDLSAARAVGAQPVAVSHTEQGAAARSAMAPRTAQLSPPSSAPAPPIAPSLSRREERQPREEPLAVLGPPATASSTLTPYAPRRELEALASIRRALAAKHPEQALGALDDFDRQFPQTRAAEEARVLRLEALNALGKMHEARALGLRFTQDWPTSVYTEKVRALTPASDRIANPDH